MIYLIFTEAGFDEAKESLLHDNAILWINRDILSKDQQALLTENKVLVNFLAKPVHPSNEKDIIAVIENIELVHPDTEIIVEYL